MGRIITKYSRRCLQELENNTSVRLADDTPLGRFKPEKLSYLIFDINDPVLTWCSRHQIKESDLEVTASQFVQKIAVFCPIGGA